MAAASRRTPSSTWSVVTAENASRSECWPPSQEEVAALDDGDAPRGRSRSEPVDVDVRGQLDPEEVAAVGLVELTARDLAAQRRGEQRRPLLEGPSHRGDRTIDVPEHAELVDGHLGEHVRRDVGVDRTLSDGVDNGGRADEIADADARAHGLGERAGGDDGGPLWVIEAEHRRQRLAAEADVDVRVVLEDRELVLAGQRDQPADDGRPKG